MLPIYQLRDHSRSLNDKRALKLCKFNHVKYAINEILVAYKRGVIGCNMYIWMPWTNTNRQTKWHGDDGAWFKAERIRITNWGMENKRGSGMCGLIVSICLLCYSFRNNIAWRGNGNTRIQNMFMHRSPTNY